MRITSLTWYHLGNAPPVVEQALERAGVRILLARITTEGDGAHDTFYLQEDEAKLTDARTRAVVDALEGAL